MEWAVGGAGLVTPFVVPSPPPPPNMQVRRGEDGTVTKVVEEDHRRMPSSAAMEAGIGVDRDSTGAAVDR